MLSFDWNDEKNDWLQRERGVTFPEVIHRLMHGGLLDNIEHPNPVRYPGQRILIVAIHDYAYLVPYVESDDVFFLKTIIPSRKMTRRYLGDGSGQGET
jgi:hypothetical protein